MTPREFILCWEAIQPEPKGYSLEEWAEVKNHFAPKLKELEAQDLQRLKEKNGRAD